METFSARAIFKDIRNFLAGRFLGATRDEFFLDEIVKLIFCKSELANIETDPITEIDLSALYRRKFRSVVNKYSEIYQNQNAEIELDPISIKYIDNKLNKLDIVSLERDLIGDAYEIFIGDSIKGQSGQFFTPQNAAKALVDMIQPSVSEKVLDLTCGAGGFLIATLKFWREHNANISDGNLYGVDKDDYLTRLCKIHLACMKYSINNIKCADSLIWDTDILGPCADEFDIILTNPPFGVNIQVGTPETLGRFTLAYKHKIDRAGNIRKTQEINASVPPQVVFVEQCIKMVKPGGHIGIVVPESMISNKKYSYVVQYIFETCYIRAVVGMPEVLFKTSGKSGTHTKTCLLVLQKRSDPDSKPYDIFMAEAKWCGHDSRGREIPKDDIPEIVGNYRDYVDGNDFKPSELGFLVNSNRIKSNVLTPRAYYLVDNTFDKLINAYYMITIGQLIDEGVLTVSTGNELGKLAYGTGNVPFVRTSDISNWEIKSDPKHLVSQEFYDALASKQDVKEGDILMVKDGSYLIGACAMITQQDTRIIFQSHLYKIRVRERNKYGLDRYYLLAALSSDFLHQQIVANTYSHDIINSLGDRLKDLVIPISKSSENRKQISQMVHISIKKRMEAREFAKSARTAVIKGL